MRFKAIEAIIFDLDGVLTNTSEYHYQAWKKLADKLGIYFDRKINEDMRGIPRRQSLEVMLGGRDMAEEDKNKYMEVKNEYYVKSLEDMSSEDILPGALELLEELRDKGIKIGIGSSSKNADTVIDKLGLRKYVDTVSDGNSVEKHKPHPDLFLHCAERLKVSPENAIVVEDAESGVEAALRGGFWTFGLGPAERVGKAHLVLPDLEGVHAEDILAF